MPSDSPVSLTAAQREGLRGLGDCKPPRKGRGPKLRPCCMESKGRPDHSLSVPRKAQRRGRSAGRGTCVGPEGEPKGPAPPQARGRAL